MYTVYVISILIRPLVWQNTHKIWKQCSNFLFNVKTIIDREKNMRMGELGELSGSSYVCGLRITDRVYVVLCDTTPPLCSM